MRRISPRLALALVAAIALFLGVLRYARAPAGTAPARAEGSSLAGPEGSGGGPAAAKPAGTEGSSLAGTDGSPVRTDGSGRSPAAAKAAAPAGTEGSGGGAAPAVPAKSAQPLDEAQLMAKLRGIKASDPAQAVELARDGLRRFPGTADAPERESIMIHALGALGRASEARGEAERMVNQYPDSPWVQDVERYTGAHRHRNVRLNDAGQLEFY